MTLTRAEMWQPITGGPRRFTRREYLHYLRERHSIRLAQSRWRVARARAKAHLRDIIETSDNFENLIEHLKNAEWAFRIMTGDTNFRLTRMMLATRTDADGWHLSGTVEGQFREMVMIHRRNTAFGKRCEAVDLLAGKMIQERSLVDVLTEIGFRHTTGYSGGKSFRLQAAISRRTLPGIVMMERLTAPSQPAFT